jgi:hypothetical protein
MGYDRHLPGCSDRYRRTARSSDNLAEEEAMKVKTKVKSGAKNIYV